MKITREEANYNLTNEERQEFINELFDFKTITISNGLTLTNDELKYNLFNKLAITNKQVNSSLETLRIHPSNIDANRVEQYIADLEKELQYKRNIIKILEYKNLEICQELDETKACYMGCNKERKKYKSKLDKIEEEVDIFNKLDPEYEMNDIDNILLFIKKIETMLKEK